LVEDTERVVTLDTAHLDRVGLAVAEREKLLTLLEIRAAPELLDKDLKAEMLSQVAREVAAVVVETKRGRRGTLLRLVTAGTDDFLP
jgi:hypothetical protein